LYEWFGNNFGYKGADMFSSSPQYKDQLSKNPDEKGEKEEKELLSVPKWI